MTDTQVALILAQIKQLKESVDHANLATTDRLTRLELTVAQEAQRVTKLEGKVDADIAALDANVQGRSLTKGRVLAFLSGAGLVLLGQVANAVIPHL